VSSFLAVSARCANPEAVVQIINMYNQVAFGDGGMDPRRASIDPPPGLRNSGMGLASSPVRFMSPVLVETNYNALANAIMTGNESGITDATRSEWANIQRWMEDPYAEGNHVGWNPWWTNFPAPGHMNYWIFNDLPRHPVVDNAFMGIMTETIAELAPLYRSLAEEKITNIIMGNDSVDSWDDFVAMWQNLAGNTIIAEIEASRR
jgi:putative aldouronate transport system substrate-binding protein